MKKFIRLLFLLNFFNGSPSVKFVKSLRLNKFIAATKDFTSFLKLVKLIPPIEKVNVKEFLWKKPVQDFFQSRSFELHYPVNPVILSDFLPTIAKVYMNEFLWKKPFARFYQKV